MGLVILAPRRTIMEDKQRFICFTIISLLIVAVIIWIATEFNYEEFICSLSAIPELCK